MSRVVLALAAAAAVAGLALTASGLWIPAKAALAQWLLATAWRDARAGAERPRPWPWADTWPVARLAFPGHDATMVVLDGASGRTLAFAPGHLDGTALPGAAGHAVVAGHRDTHFRLLRHLVPGDAVEVEAADGRRTRYRVTGSAVVDGRRARLAPGGGRPRLTLVTCYPFDAVTPSGPMRYLVFAVADQAPPEASSATPPSTSKVWRQRPTKSAMAARAGSAASPATSALR